MEREQAIIRLLFYVLKIWRFISIVSTAPSVFRLAARLEAVGFSDIVKIRNRIMELRATGAVVHQFEGGEPFPDTPDTSKRQ
jgi:hypothetical protein